MRVDPPQSLMGWLGVRCPAGLDDVISGPEGIGLVEVPAPTHTRGVGLRGLPGHRGAGLGLVGFEGRRRNLEQVVGGAATAVARERGDGTAAMQACGKGKRTMSPRPSWAASFLCAKSGLGKTCLTSHLPRVEPSGWKALGGPRRERVKTLGKVASKLPPNLPHPGFHVRDPQR